MSKTITISGTAYSKYKDDGFIHYYLVQPDGYHIDLVHRVAEIADFMGGAMSAAWYVGDTPKTKDEITEAFLGRVYGAVDSRNWQEEYNYSSYTQGTYDYTNCEIGGHSLMNTMSANEGKFILFEFTDSPTP